VHNTENTKVQNEIVHRKFLAESGAEAAWGWETPAGKVRAQRRAELIINEICMQKGMRILEIGCGNGNFTELFAKSGAQIIAVDISPDLLQIAERRNLPKDQIKFVNQQFENY